MGEVSPGSGEVVEFVSASILGGPDDSIFDDIFDWIQHSVQDVVDAFNSMWGSFESGVSDAVSGLLHVVIDPLVAVLNAVSANLVNIWTPISVILGYASSWAINAEAIITRSATSAISAIPGWLSDLYGQVSAWISSEIGRAINATQTLITNLGQTTLTLTDRVVSTVNSAFVLATATLIPIITDSASGIRSLVTDLSSQFDSTMTWLTGWMADNIVGPMAGWWNDFVNKVLDFTSWIGFLLDAVSAWVTRDVPGSSPWWQGVFRGIWNFFISLITGMTNAALSALGGFTKWFGNEIASMSAQLANAFAAGAWTVMTNTVVPIANVLTNVFTTLLNSIASATRGKGPVTPETALDLHSMLNGVGMTVIAGLAAMTIGGELTVAGSRLGLGHVSAMIYDLTNYKVLTGSFVSALALAAISTPLGYYYRNQFRPTLPDARTAEEMHSRQLITDEEYSKLLGYHGFNDAWHDKFYALSETPVGYFALANISNNGVFDRGLFERDLHRRGYAQETINLLLDMYQKNALSNSKSYGLSYALTRFTYGFTTEDQCTQELQMLQATNDEIPLYMVSAKIRYATDYIQDMITAYRDAVRAGNISIDDYRQALLNLGIVPERVGGYVLIEQARIKPKTTPSVVSPPQSVYLTDMGKIEVDTLRRQRRKSLINRDQEIAGLVDLGMPTDYAEAIADNDDTRVVKGGTGE
jgi:hypothetical protein